MSSEHTPDQPHPEYMGPVPKGKELILRGALDLNGKRLPRPFWREGESETVNVILMKTDENGKRFFALETRASNMEEGGKKGLMGGFRKTFFDQSVFSTPQNSTESALFNAARELFEETGGDNQGFDYQEALERKARGEDVPGLSILKMEEGHIKIDESVIYSPIYLGRASGAISKEAMGPKAGKPRMPNEGEKCYASVDVFLIQLTEKGAKIPLRPSHESSAVEWYSEEDVIKMIVNDKIAYDHACMLTQAGVCTSESAKRYPPGHIKYPEGTDVQKFPRRDTPHHNPYKASPEQER